MDVNSNTKKEGVSFTCKKYMGYAPMMAYIGKEGYLVNTELREGKQHCQIGTPEFLHSFCRSAHQTFTSAIPFYQQKQRLGCCVFEPCSPLCTLLSFTDSGYNQICSIDKKSLDTDEKMIYTIIS